MASQRISQQARQLPEERALVLLNTLIPAAQFSPHPGLDFHRDQGTLTQGKDAGSDSLRWTAHPHAGRDRVPTQTDGRQIFLEYEPLQTLARDGQLCVYHHEDYWGSMDTYRDCLYLNNSLKEVNPPWKIWSD